MMIPPPPAEEEERSSLLRPPPFKFKPSQEDPLKPPSSSDDDDDLDLKLKSRRRRCNHDDQEDGHKEWLRPYVLGCGLFLVLFPFWILDSLKDPMFGALTGGNLDIHQPTAKLFSVFTTLCLVCFLEYLSNERRKEEQQSSSSSEQQQVLDGGGVWYKMATQAEHENNATHSRGQGGGGGGGGVPDSIFFTIGVPYCITFGLMAYLLQFNPAVASTTPNNLHHHHHAQQQHEAYWRCLGYFLYAAIESFGSLAVATFWSFTNSTLSLKDAERYYGWIIAMAQLGAIGGSTMVTLNVWSNITLMVAACLTIVLHINVMNWYLRTFSPTTTTTQERNNNTYDEVFAASKEPTLWSGVYLILRHNYVLLILGVSCLYEVSLTCLDYQMKLLGWSRFEDSHLAQDSSMTFTQFMGHYGQMVNACSLVLSSLVFPFLIKRIGLQWTLRLFPTLLLLANFLAYGPLSGNLWVLFISLSTLKAMTYSIHDPAKELLYLPTSKAIQFKAKFWIDVVGARVAKAVGSSINHISGSVARSIQVASAPSLLTAMALWYVCYKIGIQFQELVSSSPRRVVGAAAACQQQQREHRALLLDDDDEEQELLFQHAQDDPIFENPSSSSPPSFAVSPQQQQRLPKRTSPLMASI